MLIEILEVVRLDINKGLYDRMPMLVWPLVQWCQAPLMQVVLVTVALNGTCMSEDWRDAYVAWNMAFVAALEGKVPIMTKLVAPAVVCKYPSEFWQAHINSLSLVLLWSGGDSRWLKNMPDALKSEGTN